METRCAMARLVENQSESVKKMLLESVTTSHNTPNEQKVLNERSYGQSIRLAEESTVNENLIRIREVNWTTTKRDRNITLSRALVASDVSMSLLSVTALVNKNIVVLLIPKMELLIALDENFALPGTPIQSETDGLFYIDDSQD